MTTPNSRRLGVRARSNQTEEKHQYVKVDRRVGLLEGDLEGFVRSYAAGGRR
jgi:hypothetical protein